MFRMTLYSILLLTLAVSAAVALEPEPALDPGSPESPELAVNIVASIEPLIEEAPQMSIEPQRAEAGADLPEELGWHQGICYPNTCLPCFTNDDCLLGDRCVFGAFCP